MVVVFNCNNGTIGFIPIRYEYKQGFFVPGFSIIHFHCSAP